MNSQTAYFHVQESSPNLDPREVVELLKAQERVEFNVVNEVFTYIVSGCPGFTSIPHDLIPKALTTDLARAKHYNRGPASDVHSHQLHVHTWYPSPSTSRSHASHLYRNA